MNFSSKAKKFGQSPVAAACVSLVIGMTSASALAQSASFGINFPTATPTPTEIELGAGTYGLNQDFTSVTGMAGVTIAVESVQTLYTTTARTVAASVDLTVGSGGILNTQSGGGTVTANVSDNSIAASGTGNQLTLASGGSVATIDLGLMSTNKSIGALAVQFLGSQNTTGQVNVQANVSGSTVGALFNGMYAAPIAVNSNVVKAASTLNDATTVVAGAVPLGFADSTGGSSSIYFNGTSSTGGGDMTGGSQSTLGITTVQNSVNGGISAGVDGDGSYAALTDDTIAIKTQETYDFATYNGPNGSYSGQSYTDLSAPLTLNNNTQSAAFTGNNATSVLQADATSNAFSGSASVTNAQSNVETLDYLSANTGPTAQVSNSQIVADLTYAGVQGSGVSPTEFTSSLSVSGTALAPQSISAQSIGNAAGSLNSAGQLTSSGNAIEFSNSTVDLTGSAGWPNGLNVGFGSQTVFADITVNSAQANQRPTDSGSGVGSLVSGSGITASVDRLAATGSVAVNYDAVTAGATGNLAGNLINAQGNNVDAKMAVVGTQQNISANVLTQNVDSSIGVGIGDSAGTTVAQRAATTAVSGSVTVNNDAIGAVAQGNLAANTLLVAAGNTLTAQYSTLGEDSAQNYLDSGAQMTAGLMALNLQGNADSATLAGVSGGSIFIAGVDQAGNNAGNLVPLGAATLSASSNRISALAQGNNGGTNIGASAGGAMVLTAAAANSQTNDETSPVYAVVADSSVLVSGLNSLATTIATNSNTLTADATGNLGANAINISGGSTVNGQASDNTSDLQNRQGNSGGITATASGSAVGVRLGAASSNAGSYPYGYPTTASATGADPYTSSALSSTTGDYTSMMARNVTTLAGSTLAIDDSTVAANATANQVDNRASLSGTTLGGSAAVASVIGSTQTNYGAVDSSVASTDVGVRLEDQSLTVSSTPTYSNTAVTSNSFYWGLGEDSNVDLTSASAVAGNSVSGSASGNITAIDTTTASVSASTLAAVSNGNVASNALRLSGTDVTLQSGSALVVGNNQTNSSGGSLTASVADANVGVLVGDDLSGVTGTGTSTLIGSVTATVEPTIDFIGSAGLFSGSGSATISTPVTGSMTAVGMYALTAQVDDSVLSASSVANSADNRIIVDATVLGAAATAKADVINQQLNTRTFSGGLSAVNLGVVLADVTASQTTTASGSSMATVVATDNAGGSSVANGPEASTTLSASGSATALGVNGSTVSVQRSALTASAKGNTVTNVIDLGSTVASAFAAQINRDSGDQSNYGFGSATISDVALGTVLGDVAATSTTTSTALASGSGSATDATSASATGGSAIASGSATAVVAASGLLNSTSTVSGNSLSAAVFGNEAINVVSGSGTVIGAVSGLPAVSLFNKQFNYGNMISDVGAVQLGTVVGAVSGTGSALANSTVSSSATALATELGTNGEATSGDVTSGATANAATTVTATGISGLTAASDGNLVGAVNTGNSATNAIRLASTTITGSTGDMTLFNNNAQFNFAWGGASVDNVGLGVLLTSVDAIGSATASSSATADATATNDNTSGWASGSSSYTSNSATATASGAATSTASGSATAVGITATNASVATNVLRAANTGNSASTVTSLSASSLTGTAGTPTVLGSSTQTNSGDLQATLGAVTGVTVGVSSGAVSARFTASGSASASSTADSTSYNWVDADGGAPVVNSSTDTGSTTATSSATATANATATATGMTGSTFSVLSNQLEASNMGNSAYTSAVLDGTVLGTAAAPVSARASNTQTNDGDGTATAGNINLGVMQGDVSATASGSATYYSSPSVDALNNASGSNTATSTASAYGIVNSTLSVGGTQAAPQTVTAQSVGNSATALVAATQTTGSGASGSTTLSVVSMQDNGGYQSATVGGSASPVTVGVKVGDVTATADASVAVTRTYTSGAYNYTTQDEIATTTAAGISGGSSSVQYNTLAAKTFGNSASNSLTSTTATNLAGSTAEVATFSATNIQTNTAGAISTVAAADIGVVVGDVSASSSGWNAYETAVAINAAQLAVSNNQSLATSIGNVADNSLAASAAVAGSSTLPVSSLVSNGQTNLSGQTALVDAQRVGVFTGAVSANAATGITNSSVTVASNQLQAATYGNSATNVSLLNASATANTDAIVTRNVQTNNVLASGSSTVSDTTVGVSIAGAWNGALDSTPTTVQSNTLAAFSYGNSATNATSVSGGTTLDANTAAVAFETANTQTNAAAMTSAASAIEVGVMIGTGFSGTSSGYGVDASPLVVKDNAVSAMNYANQATNSLNLTAGNVIDGNEKLARVSSTQTNSSTGSAAATVSAVDVGVIVNADGTDIADSAVTVEGNRLTAASYLNTATNTLSLAAQTLSATPATVSNAQANNATGSGAINGVNVGVLPYGGADMESLTLDSVTSTVSNNALNAQAGGNTASNVLNATASATIAGGSTPTFQVLNSQSNTGVMTASIGNAMVGNWGDTGSNYYGGTTMTVSMNSAVANAYGNTASNALSMSALTGSSNGASTGLSNSQSNTASLSATVSGVLMGVGSGQGTGTVAVSGNSIVASTVGNAATNRVGIVR